MSGFEVLGAVAGSLAVSRSIMDTLRWAKQEYDVWERAPKELQELSLYASSTEICLRDIKLKLESIVVRIALEQDESMHSHAKGLLVLSQERLSEVREYLPSTDGAEDKETFAKKFKASFNNEKTQNLTKRLNDLNTYLRDFRDCPLLQVKLTSENASRFMEQIKGRRVTTLDHDDYVDSENNYILRGTLNNGRVEARYDEQQHNLPIFAEDIAWKWLPEASVRLR